MTIRCVIVDDEQPARDELRFLLSSFDDVEIIGDVFIPYGFFFVF